MYGKYPAAKKTMKSGGKKKKAMGGKVNAATMKKKPMKMGGKRKKAC